MTLRERQHTSTLKKAARAADEACHGPSVFGPTIADVERAVRTPQWDDTMKKSPVPLLEEDV